MNRKTLLLFCALLLCGVCAFLALKQKTSASTGPAPDNKNYKFVLDSIQTTRKKLAKENAGMKKTEKVFVESISSKIFPYWYGTKWDYNGTTQIPNEGSIACGYFVTTTLRDMGVSINRVKMAQCASEEMIKSLTSKDHIHRCSGLTLAEFEKKLKGYGNGLYIVGLDNHTGYLLLSEAGNFFIHASGWAPHKVVKDKISESDILARSKYRVVGKISDDEAFLKNWLEHD